MRDYKNLLVWEKAHKLTLAVYKTTLRFPKESDMDGPAKFAVHLLRLQRI